MRISSVACAAVVFVVVGLATFASGVVAMSSDETVMNNLFDETNGPHWFQKKGWKDSKVNDRFGLDAKMHGVVYRVDNVSLPSNGLVGTITANLNGLDYLKILNLSGNTLSGPIPPLNSCTDLTAIDLSVNAFNESVNLASAFPSSATHINLSDNPGIGGIITPAVVGKIPSLSVLDVRGTAMTAPLSSFQFNETEQIAYPGHFECPSSSLVGFPASVSILYSPSFFSYQGCSCSDGFYGTVPSNCLNIGDGTRDTLNALFGSTAGAGWTQSTNWGTEVGVCSWFGVACKDFTGAETGKGIVVSVNLAGNNLVGSVADDVYQIVKLETLNLSSNTLSGALPTKWNADLVTVDVSNNQFAGPVINLPAQLSTAVLSQNPGLSGPIPSVWLQGDTSLQLLDIHATGMQGPSSDFVVDWAHATDQGTYSCAAISINGSSATVVIDPLYFSYSVCSCDRGFFGTVPASCTNIGDDSRTALTTLFNATNGPMWTTSTNWGTDADLCTWSGVTCRDFTGPESGLGIVVGLNLTANNLKGAIPNGVVNLIAKLSVLSLSGNSLSGHFPGQWGSDVSVIDLSANQLVGPVAALPPNLATLNLSGNTKLSGGLPTGWIAGDSGISYLNIQGTGMSGLATDFAYNISEPIDFGTYLCPQVSIASSPSAVVLMDPSYYAYKGCICARGHYGLVPSGCLNIGAGSRVALTALMNATNVAGWIQSTNWGTDVDLCSWFGVTCRDFTTGALTGLGIVVTVDLNSNALAGTLPTAIYQITRLDTLNLSNNSISGPLPTNWNLYLTDLNLSKNNLSGTIGPLPAGLINLYLSDNPLITGPIPIQWVKDDKKLAVLDVMGTTMRGPAADLVFDPAHPISFDSYFCPSVTIGLAPSVILVLDPYYFEYGQCACNRGSVGIVPSSCVDVGTGTRQVLVSLFESSIGTNWTTATNWNTDADVCTWFGVTCRDYSGPETGSGIVVGLDLARNGLRGSLPEDFSGAAKLEQLNLSSNSLAFTIPEHWNEGLEVLDLSNNSLVGGVAQFSGSLRFLYLNDNDGLNGSFPVAWSESDKDLVLVNVLNTGLRGSVDDFAFNASDSIVYDNYSCPAALVNGSNAEIIIDPIYYDYLACQCVELFSGDAPNCRSERNVLVQIYNATNGPAWTQQWAVADPSSDPCVSWAGVHCTDGHVDILSLEQFNMNGTLPADLSVLSSLRILSVSGNLLTGPLPAALPSAIETLELEDNPLGCGVPAAWSQYTRLKSINLADTGLEWVANFSVFPPDSLVDLDLSGNPNLNGSIDAGWVNNASALTTLNVAGTGMQAANLTADLLFNASIPTDYDEIYACAAVTLLNVTDRVHVEFSASYFNYSSCSCGEGYNGSAPHCAYTEGLLRDALVALFNALGGPNWSRSDRWLTRYSVCTWFGVQCRPTDGESIIEGIDLSDNQLVGSSIPDVFQNLTELTTLNLAGNQLSGTAFPDSLLNLPLLSTLNLSRNAYAFALNKAVFPDSLATLDLSGNPGITNTLPFAWLSAADRLTTLNIKGTGARATEHHTTMLISFDYTKMIAYGSGSFACPTPFVPSAPALVHLEMDPVYYDYAVCKCATEYVGISPVCTSERVILGDLFTSMGGAHWLNNSNWNTSDPTSPYCTWFGVCCATASNSNCTATGHVIQILMASNNLTGSVPDSLNLLYNLTVLDLQSNALSGPLPTLNALPYLTVASFNGNDFTGPIGDTLFPASLAILDIAENPGLNGSLPYSWIVDSSSLSTVIAYHTGLHELANTTASPLGFSTVPIPFPADHFSCLTPFVKGKKGQPLNLGLSPDYYDYSSCNCSFAYNGPVPGCTIDEVGTLKLIYATTGGSHWTNQQGWKYSAVGRGDALSASDLLGVDSDAWNPCSAFGVCCGNVSLFDPTTRTCDRNGTKIVGLFFESNGLNGQLPTELGLLTDLSLVKLNANPSLGSVPAEVGLLSVLEVLDLSGTTFSGSVPSSLTSLVSLKELKLSNTNLSLTLVDGFKNLTSLVEFLVAGVHLSNGLPTDVVTAWSALEVLDVSSTKLSGTVPAELFSLPNLQAFYASKNAFNGPIPSSIGDSHIVDVDLSGNRLNGSIPSSIANASSLAILLLSNNTISGQLPIELSKVSTISVLAIDNNQLNGNINSSNLPPNVAHLSINGNPEISGSFPFAWASSNKDLVNVDCAGTNLSADPNQISKYMTFSAQIVEYPANRFFCHQLVLKSNTSVTVDLDPQSYGYSNCSCDVNAVGIVPRCSSRKNLNHTAIIVGSAVGGGCAVILVAVIVIYFRRKSNRRYEEVDSIYV